MLAAATEANKKVEADQKVEDAKKVEGIPCSEEEVLPLFSTRVAELLQ